MKMHEILDYLPRTGRVFYRHFHRLQEVQKEALKPILNGENLLLTSSTGSGKTEVVVAPLAEKSLEYPDETICLYICPTRALVNDILYRIQFYFNKISVETGQKTIAGKRTGDKDDTKRTKTPNLLITTPESLDVMVSNRYSVLKNVKVVVLDDVHQLFNTPRGLQLSLLLERLKSYTNHDPQRIALSATVSDPNAFSNWLKGSHKELKIISDQSKRRIISKIFWVWDDTDFKNILKSFFRKGNKKMLIFANTRRECEMLFKSMEGDPILEDKAFLHYSSLPKVTRENVEQKFSTSSTGFCFATNTLELGIDIGDIDLIIMYNAPNSVSSFLQRMGRGNRKTNKTKAVLVCTDNINLLKFIALLSLADEGKLETPTPAEYYSVIVQQIFSIVNQAKTHRVSKEHFRDFIDSVSFLSERDLEKILESLVEKKFIEYDASLNSYRIGKKLRRLINTGRIYGNIPYSGKKLKLKYKSKDIGLIPEQSDLNESDIIFFSGKYWKIREILDTEVMVEPHRKVDNFKEIKWKGIGFATSLELANRVKYEITRDNLKNISKRFDKYSFKRLEDIKYKVGIELKNIENSIPYFNDEKAHVYYTFLGDIGNKVLKVLFEEIDPRIKIEKGCIFVRSNLPLIFSSLPSKDIYVLDILEDNYKKFEPLINPTDNFYKLPEHLKKKEILSQLKDPILISEIIKLKSKEIIKIEEDLLSV